MTDGVVLSSSKGRKGTRGYLGSMHATLMVTAQLDNHALHDSNKHPYE